MSKIFCTHKKTALQIIFIVSLIVSSDIAQTEHIQSVLSIQELKQLAPKIEAVEKHKYNLKIESNMWIETKANLSDPCAPWIRTPVYVASTAWIKGGNPFVDDFANTKIRLNIYKEVTKWEEGVDSYIEESYSVGFDGRYGRIAKNTLRYSEKTIPVQKGELFLGVPKVLKSGWWPQLTGAGFSISFLFKGRNDTLSNRFRWASDPNSLTATYFKFTREKFDGIDAIKITSKVQKGWQQSYWLDPSRGFSLLGSKETNVLQNDKEQLISFMKISKLKEVTKGIWWPMDAFLISRPLETGAPYSRTVYHAIDVVANEPNFNENIFTVPFPKGYVVNDKITGRKYKVGEK